jgi:hypothetical protein
MKVIGYILEGFISGQNLVDPRDLEESPSEYNMDILAVIDDEYINYAIILWHHEDGFDMKKMPLEYREAISLFPDNPLFVQYYDSESDSLSVHFNKPEAPEYASILRTAIDENGESDQVFLLEGGKSCNLPELMTYIEEETIKN